MKDKIKLKGFAGLSHVETKPLMTSDHDGGVHEFRRRMSNGEYLNHLCQFSNPMVGSFIIQAINELCEATIKKGDELIANEKKQQEDGIVNAISNEVWVETAKYLRLQNYYQYEN